MLRPTILAMLAALVLQGCATTQPAATNPLPGQVRGLLTAAVSFRPYAADELTVPAIREGIAQCERARYLHCRELRIPGGSRTAFTLGSDPQVIASFRSSGLLPGAAFDRLCRLLGPNGEVADEQHYSDSVPRSATPNVKNTTTCDFDLSPEMPAGAWDVEYVVNGTPMARLPFELHAGGKAE